MIRRGPNPQGNFQILPNATSRDRRLSFRARGLLALMLSYPEDFTFNRDWLARQSDQDGVTAVRSALTELEKAGYLVRRKVRIDGRFGWEQILYRTAQVVQETAGESSGGLQADGNPAAGEPPCKEDGDEDSKETLTENDMPPRSQARAEATEENPTFPQENRLSDKASDRPSADSDGTSWRMEDLDLFRSLLGDVIHSDGTGEWAKGTWPAAAFYRGFMRTRDKRWPGRWLQEIAERDSSLEYWLISEGLEVVTGDRR